MQDIELHKQIERISAELERHKEELRLEVALENVRSRTMAMQRSEELEDIIRTVLAQFVELDINIGHAGFVIDYKEGADWNLWIADPLGVPGQVTIPNIGSEWDNRFHEAIETGKDLFTVRLDFEEKNRFYHKLFDHIPGLPEEAREFYFTCPGLAISTVLLDNVALYIENFSGIPYTDEENDMLRHFGRVFQQAYTRFRDLEKAEAQTREAQIEAALERIRAASMAMHKTQDISNVVIVFFNQLKALKLNFVQAWINVFHLDEEYFDIWFSPLEGVYDEPTYFRMPSALFEETSIKSWKEGKTFSYLSFPTKADLDALMQACDEATDSNYFSHLQEILQLEGLEFVDANYKYGTVSKSDHVKATKEEENILYRFARVFEQAYTRFLDIQKAEAQAQEAQIEACLERIRARAMGMHHSDELSDVLTVMFEQFDVLGINPVYSCLDLFDLDANTFTHRITGTRGQRHVVEQVIDLDAMDIWKKSVDQWKQDRPESCQLLHYPRERMPEVWNVFSDLFNSLSEDARFTPDDFPDGMYSCAGYHKHGYVGFLHSRPTTSAENQIVIRFAKEFDRLYQRFLDLQKAETQARDALIEAALERVRAKAMSMQHSEELTAVLSVLFAQFDVLGIRPVFAHLTLFDEENQTFTFRMTGTSGQRIIAEQTIPLNARPEWMEAYRAWKEEDRESVSCIDYPPAELPAIWEIFADIFNSLPEESKIEPKDFPDGLFTTQGHCRFGYLGYNNNRKATDEEKDIVRRFSIEFGRAYQRFQDLQNAEEQARKIQLVNRENERLLHSILPQQIVEQIRSEQKTTVKRFDQVSILFADIVGFTNISEKLKPDEVVDLLNSLFSRFDDLTGKYGLEKIKTIGDAYMVAAGVPEEKEDHARVLLHYAGDMLQSLKSYNEETGNKLSLRIGISSGPVVAGVIGKTKFAYDLWGDSVNTAARMEAYGQPDRIQVSPDTYYLLRHDFEFEKLPGVNVKGKGIMDVYLWVNQ